MASSLALRGAIASTLFNKLFNPIRSASVTPSLARSFNTNSQMTTYEDENRSLDVDSRPEISVSRRRDFFPNIFSDLFDPFSPTRSVSQLLNMMNEIMENPFIASPRGLGVGPRRGWDVKEDNECLYVRVDMPGVDKENLKISVEQNTLVIKGEGEKESDDEGAPRLKYIGRMDLPLNVYKLDEIKAEMKNGVLKIRIPKVKEEERKDVRQIQVE